MSDVANNPMFNLKVVLRETGIKADTLRAWERRHGLPAPERTSGGHRLFAQRDIETVKWLLARQEEGLSISRAVDLWRNIESRNLDPLLEMDYPTQAKIGIPLAQLGGEIQELRAAWIAACKRFDEQGADQILNQAFALFPPEVVSLDLLTRALAEIGDGWYQSEVTVQQEHFASAQATRRIEALIAASPAPTIPGPILVICPPGEEHTFSSLLITFLIRRSGREAIFLGANVPITHLDEMTESMNPKLAVLSAQQLNSAAALRRMALFLLECRIPVAFGGRIFNVIPDLQNRIPGTFLGQELRNVPSIVDRLVRSPSPKPTIEPVSTAHQNATNQFLQKQNQIDAYVVEHSEAPYNHISLANFNLGQNIKASLELGDIAFLGEDISWIRGLLDYHNIPEELIDSFLPRYVEALEVVMGEDGSMIAEYLDDLISSVDGGAEVR